MKRRLAILAVFLASLMTFVGSSKPGTVRALAGCNGPILETGSMILTFNIPLGSTFTVGAVTGSFSFKQLSGTFPGIVTLQFLSNGTWNLWLCGGATLVSGGTSSNQATCPTFLDGRLNNCEPWETSAIYCLGNGSVRVYVIGQPLWFIAFDASPTEIANVPKHPAHNTLIKGAHGAWLSRLTNGSLQVTTPGLNPADGNYNFVFQDCPVAP